MRANPISVALVSLIGFLGLLMIGSGITGNVVQQEYIKPLCFSNSECTGTEVCCLFYEQESGVCNNEANCEGIKELTKNSYDMNQVYLPESQNHDKIASTIIGAIITLACAYMVVQQFRAKQPENKKKLKTS